MSSTTTSLANTYFSSSSGGKTANVQDVWPTSDPIPYLVSVKDPYDTLSPYHNWGPLRFGASKLAKRLDVPGSIVDYRANVSASGRVRTLTFVGTKGAKTVHGSSVRSLLGLRSTWFRLGLLNLTNPTGAIVYGSKLKLAGTARGVRKITLESRVYGGKWKRVGRPRGEERRARPARRAEGHDRLPARERRLPEQRRPRGRGAARPARPQALTRCRSRARPARR